MTIPDLATLPNEALDALVGDTLTFKITTRNSKFGDNRTFGEYTIWFQKGKEVGLECGPRRSTETRLAALAAARRRIREIRKHRLFVIHVTRKHIDDGEARQCNTCAISQAFWHNQERMGFPKYKFRFEVSTYGCFVDPRGIVLMGRYAGRDEDGERRARQEILQRAGRTSARAGTGYAASEQPRG